MRPGGLIWPAQKVQFDPPDFLIVVLYKLCTAGIVAVCTGSQL